MTSPLSLRGVTVTYTHPMPFVITEVDDAGVATLTLNDPDKRNAINVEMCAELVETMETLENDGAKAVIVTGAGRAFCWAGCRECRRARF
jgi:enoyl-CoA hydratase/carnithine racemase